MFLQLNLVKLFTNPHYWEIVQFQAEEKEGKLSFLMPHLKSAQKV